MPGKITLIFFSSIPTFIANCLVKLELAIIWSALLVLLTNLLFNVEPFT